MLRTSAAKMEGNETWESANTAVSCHHLRQHLSALLTLLRDNGVDRRCKHSVKLLFRLIVCVFHSCACLYSYVGVCEDFSCRHHRHLE